jgi:hypothetical protein
MRFFGVEQPKTMVVWLHSDVSSGGPANYHFPIADRLTKDLSPESIASIALVRPGYPDGEGNSSTVAFHHSGR